MIAAGCASATVLQTSSPVARLNAITLPPGPPPGARMLPCVPTITRDSVTVGVARALSNGTPLAAGMLVRHSWAPVFALIAYRLPAQSGT